MQGPTGALYVACTNGKLATAEFLIEARANVHAVDKVILCHEILLPICSCFSSSALPIGLLT